MANTNVFRGSDGTLTLAATDPNVPEGVEAQAIIDEFQLNPVGRAHDVEIHVQTDLQAYHEIGRRHPAQLRPGNIDISGRMGRAYINGALLKLLLGKGALPDREAEPYPEPTFNLTVIISDPATPGTSSVLVVNGVKLENWSYNLPEDEFVMEAVTFKGMFLTVADAQA